MVGAAPGAEVVTRGAEEGVEADASGSSEASTIVATPRAEEEAEVSASDSSARSSIFVTPGAEEGVEAGSAIIFTPGAEERAASTIVSTPGAEGVVEVVASGSRAALVVTPGAEEVDAFGSGAVFAATAGAEPDALGTSVMSGDGVVPDEAAELALVSIGVEATVVDEAKGLDDADADDDEPSVDHITWANVDVGSAALSRPDSSDGETCWDTPEFWGWETPAEMRLRPPLPLPCARAGLVGGAVPSRGHSSSERTRAQAGRPLPRPA
jgi:hypothetical protein